MKITNKQGKKNPNIKISFKRKLVALLLVITTLFSLSGCDKTSEKKTDGKTFTDSLGRTVTLPKNITRIAPSGQASFMFLFALCPDYLCGCTSEFDDSSKNYFEKKYQELPVIGQIYGGKSDFNPETLVSLHPDVVIDVGDAKDSMKEDFDKLQEQTGIPFIHIDGDLETYKDAYKTLGELLDMPTEAKKLSDYCENAYKEITTLAKNVTPADILFVTGTNGTNVIAKDAALSETINLFANNVCDLDSPSSRGSGNEVDLEQILTWNPTYILFNEDSIYDYVKFIDIWKDLDAIKNDKYFEVPVEPYNWMGYPPSVQRYLGMYWLFYKLYPDVADYSIDDKMTEYYDLFYHKCYVDIPD